MSWPNWLPYIGTFPLTILQQRELGCDPAHDWSAFGCEWFGNGFVLFVYAKISAP